jgi:hypothetical protein
MALVLATSASASAQAEPPGVAARPRAVMHEQLVALLNPMGAEHRLDLAVRSELGDQTNILFEHAHIEGGVATSLSPIYAIAGGYLQIAPFSFLVLRAEVTGAGIWPIGLDGAGYYGLASSNQDLRGQIGPDQATSAAGWFGTLSLTLQGALDLDAGTRLLFVNELAIARSVMGEAPYNYSMRYDLVTAREDCVLLETAFLGVELRVAPDLLVRFGGYDDMRNVPATGYVANQVGPIAMLEWSGLSETVRTMTVFVRGGGYTHHALRAGEPTILAGVAIDYELGGT